MTAGEQLKGQEQRREVKVDKETRERGRDGSDTN